MKNKKIINLLNMLLTAALLFSCEESTGPDNGEDPKPPGYQEDIPWPSLADSPWPMYRADPQATGRSTYAGPIKGVLNWAIDSLYIASAAISSPDTNLYLGIFNNYKRPDQNISGLLKMNLDGKINNIFQYTSYNSHDISTPIIASDGTIYISAPFEKKFFAFNADGRVKWVIEDIEVIQTGINIGKDGTIYAVSLDDPDFYLNAISSDGEIQWKLKEKFRGTALRGMSFSPDSKTLYIPGSPYNGGKRIYAVDVENQLVKWSFGGAIETQEDIPLVDSKGNIYLIIENENHQGSLLSLNKKGKVRWKYPFSDEQPVEAYKAFCMDKLGNIYVGAKKLFSINSKGELNWKKFLDKRISSSIIVDSANRVYFCIGNNNNTEVLSVDQGGTILWKLAEPDLSTYLITYSLSIGFDNNLYVPGFETFKLISIK